MTAVYEASRVKRRLHVTAASALAADFLERVARDVS